MLRSLATAFSCLLAAAAGAAEQHVEIGDLDAVAWSEESRPGAKQPVIVFSHGFHGCATQSRFLMEAFAKAGYLVFAPNHRDATCNGGDASWLDKPAASFKSPGAWSEATFRDRADDIRQLIAAAKADPRWKDADWSSLALAGHSLGGYTVLGLAGGWPGWKIDGIKAVLALSPYSQPFVLKRTLKGLDAPVMYQGGTLDYGITPTLHKSMGAYDQSPSPKYFVEFQGAGHFAWADVGFAAHDPIVAYSVAFMDRYVKGDAEPALTEAEGGVASLRYESELGTRR